MAEETVGYRLRARGRSGMEDERFRLGRSRGSQDDLRGSFAITAGGASIWRLTGLPLPRSRAGCGSLESAMRRGRSCRVADCRRMRADTQRTSSAAGSAGASDTCRARATRHGPGLARPGSRRLRRRSSARTSTHGIDGSRGHPPQRDRGADLGGGRRYGQLAFHASDLGVQGENHRDTGMGCAEADRRSGWIRSR